MEWNNLARSLEAEAGARWRAIRGRLESGYTALVLPRMLLRRPCGDDTVPARVFAYQESIGAHGNLLWGNAAFASGSTTGAPRPVRAAAGA